MKEITVNAIKKGTVIDHIPAFYTYKVADILGLENINSRTVIASNLPSKKHGMKGIIKISNIYLDKEVVQKIALIAPKATVSKIDNFKVIDKTQLERPKLLKNLLKCFNPNCITNKEPMDTKFVVEKEKPLVVRCGYCEREMHKEDIELL